MREPIKSVDEKLEAVRRAAQCEYPSGDIERMLDEIEIGYLAGMETEED